MYFRFSLISLLFLNSFFANAQQFSKNYFSWPLKGKIDLSGNFGEIRTNHFHSGLDLRTENGNIGVPVYASADGYISRINISSKGYGKALYISHPNGFTTVYGHLDRFIKKIENYSEKIQYQKQVYETEIFPERNFLKIKKGELIAYSGNTGGSAGPHLHFEIRNTKTEEIVNPLLWGLNLKDNLKPLIKSLYLYRIDNNYKTHYGNYRFAKFDISNHSFKDKIIHAGTGVFAFGITYQDMIHDAGFGMGIYKIRIYVDNKLYFEQKVDKFSFSNTRKVNCYMDYALFDENETRVVKLFIDDGNNLNFYPIAQNRGKITLKKSDKLRIRIIISDFAKNKDSISFVLTGENSIKADLQFKQYKTDTIKYHQSALFYPHKTNILKYESNGETVKVEAPVGVFYDTVLFGITKTDEIFEGKNVWQISNSCIPLNDNLFLYFKTSNTERKIITRLTKEKQKKPEITFEKDGFIYAKIKNTGLFILDIDTTKPYITDVIIDENKFSAIIKDNFTGIKDYLVKIDDKWILAYYEPKKNLIEGKIPDFIKCGIHKFSLKISDNSGNSNVFEQTFSTNNCLKSMKLKTGDKAPNFTTKDQNGNTVNFSEISKTKVVLYFYPKDDTPGCTAEACNLRDNYEMLLSKGYKIFGVSPDSIKQHIKFIEKYKLPFDLLTDEDHKIAEAYGTWVEKSMYGRSYMGMARVTFIIENGTITEIIEKVDTKNHANQILK
ncbi:MAG: thioredoxin-dependent thiol peroxidase [Bacteroidetes bacterium]|nr:thioredoxin-dependent thiol peroxidase [Bacteroidota bacterium]